jgi:hypothetical protein
MRYRGVAEMNLEFGAGGGHSEHLWTLNAIFYNSVSIDK